MIGQQLYGQTVVVLNKCGDGLDLYNNWKRELIREYWRKLTPDNNAEIRENRPPRGDPLPIVELIWKQPPGTFALAEELRSGKKLCKTTVGKVYRKHLEKEIKGSPRKAARRKELKEELKRWKKNKDMFSDLQGGTDRITPSSDLQGGTDPTSYYRPVTPLGYPRSRRR